MTYNIEGKEITVDDKLVKEYEVATGVKLTQDEIDFMAHGAIKKNKSIEDIELHVIKAIKDYAEMGRRMPEIAKKIEAGDIHHGWV